jgi:TRAP-type mannitol/chloroaromatic compound transport system permease small subunit
MGGAPPLPLFLPGVRAFIRSISSLSRWAGRLAALLVLVLIVLMNYEVTARYVFSAPTIWSYEVSTMVMGASFVLAIGYAVATDSHVRVDLLAARLGARGRAIVDLAGYALLLPILLWLTHALWGYFYGAYATGETSGQSAWNPRVWPFRLMLLAGAAAWTLQVLAEIARAALALAGRAPPREGP